MVCESLLREGVDTIFGLPGGAILPPIPDAAGVPGSAPHPGAPRTGRRSRSRRLRPRHRTPRRVLGHVRPRRHQPGDRHRHRADGLDPHGRHHRPGWARGHRQRRLPGDRHHRHNPAHHQAQLPGDDRRGNPVGHPRGLLHRLHRQTGACASRHSQGRVHGGGRVRLPRHAGDGELQAQSRPPLRAGEKGREAHQGCEAARHHRRTRRDPVARLRRAARVRREDADTGHHHAHGRQLLPHQPRALLGLAGNARHGLREPRHRRGRPADSAGHALRRPDHWQSRAVRPQFQEDTRGHRPVGDRQERARRPADCGRPAAGRSRR